MQLEPNKADHAPWEGGQGSGVRGRRGWWHMCGHIHAADKKPPTRGHTTAQSGKNGPKAKLQSHSPKQN